MIPPQLLISIGLVAAVVVIAFFGYTAHNYLIHVGLVATPLLIFLVNNPNSWLVLILGLYQSGLVFPGIPQGLQVVHVMMLGFSLLILAQRIILKANSHKWTPSDYFLMAFVGVVLATIAVRGFGLRALGGESWGGMGYVKLLLAAGFLLAARHVLLSAKQLRQAIALMLALSTLPAVAEMLFLLSDGAIYQQYNFVTAHVSGLLSSLQVSETGRGVARFVALSGLSSCIYMLALVVFPFKGAHRITIIFLVLVSLVAAGLSGFRTTILATVGTIGIFSVLSTDTGRMKRAMAFLALAVLAFLFLIPLVPYMTPSMQRTLSWLPLIKVPLYVKMDAEATTLWRIEIWKMAWAEVPNYLWVGKGFAINPMDFQAMSVRGDSILGAFLSHNYHSGPLTLLLDLGAFGFIVGTGFMLTSGWEAFKTSRNLGSDPFIRRFYIFFLSQYLYGIPAYFIIFGDVRESFSSMFISFAILRVAANASRMTADSKIATRIITARTQRAPASVLGKNWSPAPS